MDEGGVDALAAIRRRMSVRSYSGRPVEPALLERLVALSGTADHLTGVSPRIALVNGVEQTQRVLAGEPDEAFACAVLIDLQVRAIWSQPPPWVMQ